MLEIYLQETAALNVLPRLTPAARERVARFAAAAGKLVFAATRSLQLAASWGPAAAGAANCDPTHFDLSPVMLSSGRLALP